MDIYTYLQADHRKVSQLFEVLLAAHANQRKENLFGQIKEELILHSKTEHDTFYKALEAYSELKETIQHANKEHEEIERYLDMLAEMATESKKWLINIGELKHAVEHHVNKEEKDIFPKAKKVLSDQKACELAKEMDMLKKQIYTS